MDKYVYREINKALEFHPSDQKLTLKITGNHGSSRHLLVTPEQVEAIRDYLALHPDTSELVKYNNNYYHVKDASGNTILPGSRVTSFRGEPAIFSGIERGPEHNGTAKIIVRMLDSESPSGMADVRSFYHTVFNLTVTRVYSEL